MVLGRDERALRQIESRAPLQVKVLAGDLSNFSLGQEAVDLASSAFGRVDGLIVNHGTLGDVNRIANCDLESFRKTFDINFISAVACVSYWWLQKPSILMKYRSKQPYLSFVSQEVA